MLRWSLTWEVGDQEEKNCLTPGPASVPMRPYNPMVPILDFLRQFFFCIFTISSLLFEWICFSYIEVFNSDGPSARKGRDEEELIPMPCLFFKCARKHGTFVLSQGLPRVLTTGEAGYQNGADFFGLVSLFWVFRPVQNVGQTFMNKGTTASCCGSSLPVPGIPAADKSPTVLVTSLSP